MNDSLRRSRRIRSAILSSFLFFGARQRQARLLIDELLVLIYNEGEEQKFISKRLIGGAEHGYIEHHT